MSSENVATLVSMGFEESKARSALEQSNGNLEQAANWLLSGTPLVAPSPSSNSTLNIDANLSGAILQGTQSQYNVPNGKSACTCMALTVAERLLSHHPLTAELLDDSLQKGSTIYRDFVQSSAMEHTGVEDVIHLFSSLNKIQTYSGVLSQDPNHPLGLSAILSNALVAPGSVAIVTKPPESILLYRTEADSYCIVDSHPRPPMQTNIYAHTLQTLSELVLAVNTLWPYTQLDDVPEIMMEMYNSFDITTVALKDESTSKDASVPKDNESSGEETKP